jgi:hypothetical protein
MNNSGAIKMFADEIRKIFQSDPGNAGSAIEIQVAANCAGMSDDEKRTFLFALINNFKPNPDTDDHTRLDDNLLNDIISLLLGRGVISGNVPSHEMLKKLSVAMNTLFSTLNRIVKTIDATLAVHESGDQTIRSLIGSQMDGKNEGQSMEDYLGRIEKAFLVSHQAFRQAAHTIFSRILDELNPDAITNGTESRFKFGPMRKAEYFDIYETRFATLRKWHESGRFMKDFLREFENNCQPSL